MLMVANGDQTAKAATLTIMSGDATLSCGTSTDTDFHNMYCTGSE